MMENTQNEAQRGGKNLVDTKPFFCKNNLSDNPQNKNIAPRGNWNKKIDKNFVLDTIRNLSPIPISDLKRELGIGYSTLWNIIREFQYVGLINTKIITDKNNQEIKIIEIPKIKNKNLQQKENQEEEKIGQ